MHRFFLPSPKLSGNTLRLTPDEAHHCVTVLRVKSGDRVSVFDGAGSEYLTETNLVGEREVELHVLQKSQTPRPTYSITLAQALPKNKAMDLIVQKATELGVAEIIPVLSDRSVVRLDAAEAGQRVGRWREISLEAAKQCGQNWLPRIAPPCSVKDAVERGRDHDWNLIGSLQPGARPLWEHAGGEPRTRARALLMIGPEGDFTPAEVAVALGAGFHPLSLGPLVLRSETAAIFAVSIVSYELQRK